MRVLFIGGTGVISSACSQLAVEKGLELVLLNRGKTKKHLPYNIKLITTDIRDFKATKKALKNLQFDVVVDWIAYKPEHINDDFLLFARRIKQYIFISSASVYQTPPANLPITENTLCENRFWPYALDKIACEKKLYELYQSHDFPITIVRPSHTYDCTMLPCRGKYTTIDRMRRGKKVIIHGDGTSLWTLTHHKDFAKGFVGLLGNERAIGESFHITSDEILTWNQIYETLADTAGTKLRAVNVPSVVINKYDPEIGVGLIGDKMHSKIFDNSKIKKFVPEYRPVIPFKQGAQEIMTWFDNNPRYKIIDQKYNDISDYLIAHYEQILSNETRADVY